MVPSLPEERDFALFGLFDGHGGKAGGLGLSKPKCYGFFKYHFSNKINATCLEKIPRIFVQSHMVRHNSDVPKLAYGTSFRKPLELATALL